LKKDGKKNGMRRSLLPTMKKEEKVSDQVEKVEEVKHE
jgi:hypothetical protein